MARAINPFLLLVCLTPLSQLAHNFYHDDLTANPIEYITRFTGSWALIFIIASLAVTPIRRLSGWHELIRCRRMLGLCGFLYAVLHFATYMVLDLYFDFGAIAKDILKRPYITVGFSALLLMIPLAATSTAAMIRRLGKRWQQLHYLAYAVAVLGVVHFCWLVKADISRPAQYGFVPAVLLGYRIIAKWAQARPQRTANKADPAKS